MSKEYNIAKSSGQCLACKAEMTANQEFVATVRESDEELLREDYCLSCWQEKPRDAEPGIVGVWRSHIAPPEEKKKLFVDDELLVNVFHRLEDAQEGPKLHFRFVLALVLMRKKMLVYDRMAKGEDGREVWSMHFKGSEQVHPVVNPNMDEDKIAQVSQQLGQILEREL